jgi:pyruvate, water dikinase
MKTSSEVRNRLFEGSMPGAGEERREAIFSHRRAVTVMMNGRAASPGTATGRVAVVMHRDDIARVKEGAVIVARTASPELVMGMCKAHAIVTEYGGQGAAASWFAREYGIPAVVGVADLIKTVREGDLVRVDGTKGTVEILVPHI